MQRLASLARSLAPLAVRGSAAPAGSFAVASVRAEALASCAAPAAAGALGALCGRGDKRTAKGKRFKGSNGTCCGQRTAFRSLGFRFAHAL